MEKLYRVAPGITEINGAPVPASRLISLTDGQALYDLAHGRLTPARSRKPKSPKAPK